MLIGVIGDIHGNIDALQAIVAEFKRLAVDDVLCAGDVVGYGAAPGECIDFLKEHKIFTIEDLKTRLDDLEKETVDLSALVREEVKSFQGMAEFMGKVLEAETEDALFVRGDRNALGRLVRQLCDNAVKYAPEGDTIRIRLCREGRDIRLTEENSLASPLTDEALSHLFDRFYRPDASRSRESGGYGIGLSMVRSIAEKHGGRIRAERVGSDKIRFVCQLPAAARSSR